MSFSHLIDLAAERLGGAVLAANDEFFAPKDRLLLPSKPEWREGLYTERGKWMDGWETRRRRTPGYDWCVIRLGLPGVIRGLVVDTSWFTGNYPEQFSLDGCEVDGTPGPDALLGAGTTWHEIVPRTSLAGDTQNPVTVESDRRVTHLRLNIYPDGGVARFRVYGEARPDEHTFRPGHELDLAAIEHGGVVSVCSNMHYGNPQNMLMPGRSTFMGDGWETRRRRGPGHDWAIVRLARRATIHRIELDTDHYKGNAPGSCFVERCDDLAATTETLTAGGQTWRELLPSTPLEPHARHRFTSLVDPGPATHLRLNIYPDGGVARFRAFGTIGGSAGRSPGAA
jgi:allantoicase